MEKEIIAAFDESTQELLTTLSSFTQQTFNQVPFEGSWTAGQVAEHLLKAESNVPRVLRGGTKPTDRNPFEKVAIIQSIFLDFTTKLQSPEFILPSNEIKEVSHFINGFTATREEIKNLIASIDLSKTCIDFPFPKLGELTGWEWICFAACHAKRHIHQLKSIAQKINQTTDAVV